MDMEDVLEYRKEIEILKEELRLSELRESELADEVDELEDSRDQYEKDYNIAHDELYELNTSNLAYSETIELIEESKIDIKNLSDRMKLEYIVENWDNIHYDYNTITDKNK